MVQRRSRHVAVALALVVTVASCSSGDETGSRARDLPEASGSAPRNGAERLALLKESGERTGEEPTLRFKAVVGVSFRDEMLGMTLRGGAYEPASDSGFATALLGDYGDDFYAHVPFAALDSGYQDLEVWDGTDSVRVDYRLADGILWQRVSGTENPARWDGYEQATLTQQGVEASDIVNGARYLRGLLDAVTSVDDVEQGPVGMRIWRVRMDADRAAPLSLVVNAYQRLLDEGFDGETGLSVPARVTVDSDGRVTEIDADLTRWWDAVSRETGAGAGEQDADVANRMLVTFGSFGDPLEVTAPCPDPTPDSSGAVPVVVCPG